MGIQSANTIRAILFDLDGTLRHSKPGWVDVLHGMVSELGFEIPSELNLSARRWIHRYWANSEEMEMDEGDSGGVRDKDFWIRYTIRHLEVLGVPREEAKEWAPSLFERMMEEYQPEDEIAEGSIPTLKQLRAVGYLLGLVSNREKPLTEVAYALGIGDLFHLLLAGGEVGLWKPNPQLFLYVVDLIGVEAHEAVYVGDNYFVDVQGARAAGLHPILIDPLGIFPDADCPVISSIPEIRDLLSLSANAS